MYGIIIIYEHAMINDYVAINRINNVIILLLSPENESNIILRFMCNVLCSAVSRGICIK